MRTEFVILMAIFLFTLSVCPVSASVTYSDEYYHLNNVTNTNIPTAISDVGEWSDSWAPAASAYASELSAIELHKLAILMEKQNELIAEQNEAIWVGVCYAPKSASIYGDKVAWENECSKHGYPITYKITAAVFG
jgi:hypothetical protein